jgi:hypothetical protein
MPALLCACLPRFCQLGSNPHAAPMKEVQASSAALARTSLMAKIAAMKASLPSEEHGGLARRW